MRSLATSYADREPKVSAAQMTGPTSFHRRLADVSRMPPAARVRIGIIGWNYPDCPTGS